MRRPPPPDHPLREPARKIAAADAWIGARTAARARHAAAASRRHIPAEIDLGEPSRSPVTTLMLFGAAAVSLAEFGRYGIAPTAQELADAGGTRLPALAVGDWWTVLVSNLLHGGVVHLLLNLFVIALVGRWLEHLAGAWLTACVIAVSGLAAGVAAVVVSPAVVTIGASGVAFGLVGAGLAIDPRARSATGVIARQFAVVNIIATFLVPGISVAGHLAGLAAGIVVGSAGWSRRPAPGAPLGRRRRIVLLPVSLAAAPAIAVLAAGPAALPPGAGGWRTQVVAPLLERQLSADERLASDGIDCRPARASLEYRCERSGAGKLTVRFGTRAEQPELIPR